MNAALAMTASMCAVAGAADIIANERVMNTIGLAEDGGTVVLGGRITDDRQLTQQKVPVLGDLPLVGNPFKSRCIRAPAVCVLPSFAV